MEKNNLNNSGLTYRKGLYKEAKELGITGYTRKSNIVLANEINKIRSQMDDGPDKLDIEAGTEIRTQPTEPKPKVDAWQRLLSFIRK